MSYTGDNGQDLNAIVTDIGTYSTRIGYAGEDYPRSYINSVSLFCF